MRGRKRAGREREREQKKQEGAGREQRKAEEESKVAGGQQAPDHMDLRSATFYLCTLYLPT